MPRRSKEDDVAYSQQLDSKIKEYRQAKTEKSIQDDGFRLEQRKRFIPPTDKRGLERILGKSDLLGINYLQLAYRASRAVCRIKVRNEMGNSQDYGTGFLVAPGLLLTNNHVLPDQVVASQSLAEFDHELDENFVARERKIFTFNPAQLFVTSTDFDFTLVAISPLGHDGTPVTAYPSLALIRETGKAVAGEYVSIIQHPGSDYKQIVMRENKLININAIHKSQAGGTSDDGPSPFVHYTTDTEPGSSGAPVLNDQLDVVAIHHRAVLKYNSEGQILNKKGRVWTEEMGPRLKAYVANEGVRISAIFELLDDLAATDPDARTALVLLRNGIRSRAIVPSNFSQTALQRPPRYHDNDEESTDTHAYDVKLGYDPKFLAGAIGSPVPLPSLTGTVLRESLKADASSLPLELKYVHFSVVMNETKRFPVFTAVNIDGKPGEGSPGKRPAWRNDPRAGGNQAGKHLYLNSAFDRGHMVRRLDPVWGTDEEKLSADLDTFHYTNAVPQVHDFNDGLWGDLEDYILDSAWKNLRRTCVFTGPVFDESNVSYGHDRDGGPYLIPARFWKVVVAVVTRRDGDSETPIFSATAFLMEQTEYLNDLKEGLTPLSETEVRIYQKPLAMIEQMTGLDFGSLKQADPLVATESTDSLRRIRKVEAIKLT